MSVDFTPELKPYSGISKFHWWCHKIIPLVYDESLSYYELLCKVVDYLNHMIEDLTNAETNIAVKGCTPNCWKHITRRS